MFFLVRVVEFGIKLSGCLHTRSFSHKVRIARSAKTFKSVYLVLFTNKTSNTSNYLKQPKLSIMAIFKPAPAFENISGALTKINKKSPHAADQKMVLAQHRVAPTKTKNGCNRLYLRGLESVTRSDAFDTCQRQRAGTAFAVRADLAASDCAHEDHLSDLRDGLCRFQGAERPPQRRAYLPQLSVESGQGEPVKATKSPANASIGIGFGFRLSTFNY